MQAFAGHAKLPSSERHGYQGRHEWWRQARNSGFEDGASGKRQKQKDEGKAKALKTKC
jgi:hypothetical protein